ncbi:hypothetical protein DICVIV_13510 [Dictyocaulus viviparus]|uniref:Integrase catalytic domain-containing protein n=1 Tax=Dictyocaulus viviparus TaxID=29172 RepID=A0A0D8X9T5_DICVI|nr:hypothetical protein DICVIV_13510 [Dictyocaulus viviparus]
MAILVLERGISPRKTLEAFWVISLDPLMNITEDFLKSISSILMCNSLGIALRSGEEAMDFCTNDLPYFTIDVDSTRFDKKQYTLRGHQRRRGHSLFNILPTKIVLVFFKWVAWCVLSSIDSDRINDPSRKKSGSIQAANRQLSEIPQRRLHVSTGHRKTGHKLIHIAHRANQQIFRKQPQLEGTQMPHLLTVSQAGLTRASNLLAKDLDKNDVIIREIQELTKEERECKEEIKNSQVKLQGAIDRLDSRMANLQSARDKYDGIVGQLEISATLDKNEYVKVAEIIERTLDLIDRAQYQRINLGRRKPENLETTKRHSGLKTSKANVLIADTTTNGKIVMQPWKGEITNAQILAGKAQLSIDPRAQSIQPEILLGCGDMFSLLDKGLVPKKILPSGLLLISSKLGNLITGANERDHITSGNSTVLFRETKDSTNELEEQSWEEFCTFESTGIHEYTGPTSKERELENAAIWKQFEETIEKRDDGYYVKLPWKYNANTLPDNKGMAIKRLHATLKALKNKPAILHKYNETIKGQLQQNVIEEVDESSPNRGAIVHYLPHQAVLTPNKETTQLRVDCGTLVRNRTNEIRRIVSELDIPVQFGYVTTELNVADCAIRGLNKTEFKHHTWWTGPSFIKEQLSQNHYRLFSIAQETEHEETAIVLQTSADIKNELLDWSRINQLRAAKRITVIVLRFIRRLLGNVREELRNRVLRSIPEIYSVSSQHQITATDNEIALRILIRNHQATHYLRYSQRLLRNLNVYQDKHGILRCKGRIGKSDASFETKRPILIIPHTALAEAIITEHHLPYHAGTNQTMGNVRSRFWKPRLRQMTRRIVRKCIPCQKMNNLPYRYPTMDDLPERRVVKSRPFEHIGIDYFGPLSIRDKDHITKGYGLILTCATTRLLHLELVMDMTTNELLLALRRFFARRGIPRTITSDNAANFSLAEQILLTATIPITGSNSFTRMMADHGSTAVVNEAKSAGDRQHRCDDFNSARKFHLNGSGYGREG